MAGDCGVGMPADSEEVGAYDARGGGASRREYAVDVQEICPDAVCIRRGDAHALGGRGAHSLRGIADAVAPIAELDGENFFRGTIFFDECRFK